MKVLILSCNTGQGHNSVASAITERLNKRGIDCDTVDALGYISKSMSKIIAFGHIFLYCRMPGVMKTVFDVSEKNRDYFGEDAPIGKLLSKAADNLYKYCRSGEYDTLIATHPFTAFVADKLINYHSLPAKAYFVATDYTCSPTVEKSALTRYFIPHTELIDEFAGYGINKDRITPCGIPIKGIFFGERTPRKYPDCLHILLMCGSMGCGPIGKLSELIAERLDENTVLTVVCGTNKRLYRKLSKMFGGNIHVNIFGYVKNMSKLLDSADLYLTKPGGISVTEASVKRIPMVLVDVVAGCEEPNLRFFVDHGCAVTAKTPEELAELTLSILKDDNRCREMKEAYDRINPTDAAETITETILREYREEVKIN